MSPHQRDSTFSQLCSPLGGANQAGQTSRDVPDAMRDDYCRELEAYRAEQVRLERRLNEVESKYRLLLDDYVRLDEKHADATKLVVAASRLHAGLSQNYVIQIIFEIVANLLGCEEVAIFQADYVRECLCLLAASGVDADASKPINYGEGAIGLSVLRGEVYLSDQNKFTVPLPGEMNLTACIPLKVEDRITGVIATFRLLPHKTGFDERERELIEFLGRHAGMALYTASLHEEIQANQLGSVEG